MPHSDIQRRLIDLLKLLGVAALYALLGWLAIAYSVSGFVTVVWPASGLALAALLMFGRRYAAGVFLGALLTYLLVGQPFWVAIVIAIGNTQAALFGASLLIRNSRFDPTFRSLRDYLRLVLLAGGVASSISALIGTTTLLVSGFLISETYFLNLVHWWMGDTLGVILLTPFILVWGRTQNARLEKKKMLEWMERILLIGMSFLAGQVIFFDWFHDSFGQMAKGYWMFLFVAWAAMRQGLRGAMAVILITAVQGLLGAYQGTGFFADDITSTQPGNYWFYMVILSVVGMALATYFSELKQTGQALKSSEARQIAIFEATPDAILVSDERGIIVMANKQTERMLGYTASELVGQSIELLVPERFRAAHPALRAKFAAASAVRPMGTGLTVQARRKDGSELDVEISLSPIQLDEGLFFASALRDVTERNRAQEALSKSEARLRTLVETIPDLVWLKDEQGVYLQCNPMFERCFGVKEAELVGKTDYDFGEENIADHLREQDLKAMAAEKPSVDEEEIIFADDGHHALLETIRTPLRNADGKLIGVLGIARDITKRREAEEEIRQLAFYDPLTRLPNRRLLIDRLGQILAAGKRSHHYGALMFVDLDNFKPLNDQYGHEAGDFLLVEVARRITSCIRETDTAARFGGDEFVVILNELDTNQAKSMTQASLVAEKIRAILAEPYSLTIQYREKPKSYVEYRCSSSIGAVLFIGHEASQEDILKRADVAMYQAKKDGRDLIRFFKPEFLTEQH